MVILAYLEFSAVQRASVIQLGSRSAARANCANGFVAEFDDNSAAKKRDMRSAARSPRPARGRPGSALNRRPALSYLVGLYALVSITLNTFDVPVPEA
jgi:hypothetical protein